MHGNNDFLGRSPKRLIEDLRALADDLEAVIEGETPGAPRVSIDSWTLVRRAVPSLLGRVEGHPEIRDGAPSCTSEVFYLDVERGLARTLSRWYRLESPFPQDLN